MCGRLTLIFGLLILCSTPGGATAAEPDEQQLSGAFEGSVRPFLDTYCVSCHGKTKPKGDFDVSPFTTMKAVVETQAMAACAGETQGGGNAAGEGEETSHRAGPAGGDCLDHSERADSRQIEMRAIRASVLARRLSNAEYDYTIRDLTGVDIRPDEGIPRRSRQPGRVRQLRRIADHVAGATEEVSRGGAVGSPSTWS